MKFNGFYDGVDNGHPARDPYMREALRSVNGALKRYQLGLAMNDAPWLKPGTTDELITPRPDSRI